MLKEYLLSNGLGLDFKIFFNNSCDF